MPRIEITGPRHPFLDLAEAELKRYVSLFSAGSEDGPDYRFETGVHGIHPQGYVVSTRGRTVTIAGAEPIGVLYGVYGYLEALGFGFFIGGDVIPRRDGFEWRAVELRAAPVFEIRGSLVWPNFLNSPGTWDLPDYQVFFDQMVKMKNNVVHIPAYGTPFEAHPPDGTAVDYVDSSGRPARADPNAWSGGEPLPDSLNYGWGTPTMAWGRAKGFECADFGYGTGDWFETAVYGSSATVEGKDREEKIVGAQKTFAEALIYANRRGLKTVLGIEVHGNPFDSDRRRELEARIKHVLSVYPTLDYLAIWQAEARSWWCPSEQEVRDWHATPAFAEEYRRDSRHFAYLGRPDLIAEAVRMGVYVKLAREIVAKERPAMRLLVCGWGGDRWMRFTDFYPGFDKTLPADVIFSALDNIDPSAEPCISRVYGEVSKERERWPVPWFESDGGGSRRDQWGPQTNTHLFSDFCRDAHGKGCQGLVGIHWRTRDLEEVLAYCARYAWDSNVTFEGFYDDYARRAYGPAHAEELARALRELEHMGPRWTGSWGQPECATFEWIARDSKPNWMHISRLAQIRKRLSEILAELETAGDPLGQDRLRWLILTIDWLTKYDEAALLLQPGGAFDFFHRNRVERFAPGVGNEDLEESSWELLRELPIGDAMLAFARKVSSRGELGALATINVKAYSTLTDLYFIFGLYRGNWAPTHVRGRGDGETASVEWRPTVTAAAYRVWRRQARGEWACLTTKPITQHRFEDRPPSPGVFEYAVSAVAAPKPESLKSIGAKVHVGPESHPPLIQVISPPTVLWADDHLVVRAIVTSERDLAFVRLRYRTSSVQESHLQEFRKGRGATYRLELPLKGFAGQVLLYGIEAEDQSGHGSRWPTGYPAVWRSANVLA